MKRRTSKIHEFQVGQGTKVLCAKFGNLSKGVLVSGDDKNNVNLWKLSKDKPLFTLNHQNSTQNAQVEVTSVLFSYSDTEVFSGSNRGIINIWDISQQKLQSTLKGHTVGISTLSTFPLEEAKHLLISGSFDTNVKVWDIRQRAPVQSFKGHSMQINSISCSPDGRIIASGSSDGLVKIWDLNGSKCLSSFTLHDAPVNSVKFNPQDMALASGGSDRTVKYWDLESFSIISSTKPDTTPIQQILFSEDGKHLFSAAHESLKVWNLEKDGLLLDNVECQWRGIQDMTISDIDNMLLGLSATSSQFSLWACPLKLINTSEDYLQQKQQMNSRQSNQQTQVANPPLIKQGSYAQQYKQNRGGQGSDIKENMNEILASIQQVNLQMNNLDRIKQEQQQQYQQELKSSQIENQKKQMEQQIKLQEEMLRQSEKQLREQLAQQKMQQEQIQQWQSQQKNQEQKNSHNSEEDEAKFDQEDQMKLSVLQEQYHTSSSAKKGNQQKQQQQHSTQQQQENDIIEEDIPVAEESETTVDQVKQRDILQEAPIQQSQVIGNKSQLVPPKVTNDNDNFNKMDMSTLTIADGNFNMSSIYHGLDKEKFQQFDLIGETLKEHEKFTTILSARINYMKPILHWWSTGNIKSALHAINQLTDTSLLMDALNMSLSLGKLQYLNIEGVATLVCKARLLLESKYSPHIKCGLSFSTHILSSYKDEIINIKSFQQLSKVDLAREERILSYDKLVSQLQSIYQLPRLKKIAERGPEDLRENGIKLLSDLRQLFQKIEESQRKK